MVIPSSATSLIIQEYINTPLHVSARIGLCQRVPQHYKEVPYMYAVHMCLYRDFLPLKIKIGYIKILIKLKY
jgi:hypothetical protein